VFSGDEFGLEIPVADNSEVTRESASLDEDSDGDIELE